MVTGSKDVDSKEHKRMIFASGAEGGTILIKPHGFDQRERFLKILG